MPTGTRAYRLRIRTPDNSADLFIATSLRDGINPYIGPDAPTGEGMTLDPLTGKVTVGAYTVKVIDAPGVAYNPGAAVFTEDFESGAVGWSYVNTFAVGEGDVSLAGPPAHGGSVALNMATFVSPEEDGDRSPGNVILQARKLFTGLTPNGLYRCSIWGQMDERSWYDVHSRFYANGVYRAVTTDSVWQELVIDVRASATGTIDVVLQREWSFIKKNRNVWWDDLTIQPLAASSTLEGRVVTSALADYEARQQLLSKLAFVEESEDDGTSWSVLTAGYVNAVRLTDALLYEIAVGESQRVEQTKKVFDRISDPYEHPELIGIMDRSSVIAGGPVVGNWGGNRDRGRPLFTVLRVWGTDIVELGWTNGGGSLHSVYKEDGPPMKDYIAEYMTDAAREYLDFSTWETHDGRPFAPCPDLVGRIYDADTGDWIEDQTVLMFAPEAQSPTDIGDWILGGQHFGVHVRWLGTVPSEGDQFRLAIFPKTTSERNPMHYSGHPMDLVRDCCLLTGMAIDETSRLAMRSYLGDDLIVHYRFKEGDTHQSLLEKVVYGPFGVAPRLNDDGALEFFATRNPESTSVATITLDNLIGEPRNPWGTDEASAINRVILETQKFALDKRRPDDHQTPFDARRVASVTVNVKEPSTDEQAIFGDRDQTFTLPGCIQVGEEILAAGTPSQGATPGVPGPLDLYLASMAQPIFDWQARGSVRIELDVRRGVTDARVGDYLTLDLPYLPSANATQSPVSQRGTDLRKAIILRRTVKPECISFLVEDRGLDAALDCEPEFSLDPDATFPKTTVAVTIDNEVDLTHPVRVEMAVGASEPAGNGQFVRLWRPNQDANPFNLPVVCSGNTVWVRMRCELGGVIGDWTVWSSIDLADLTAPSGLTAVVNNTSVLLDWTNGENLAVEVLFKLDTETEYHSATVLPAGSTQYTLLLTEAEADYDFAVRHVDAKGCTSAMATISTSTDVAICLDPPTALAAFADGAGTYGVEVTATVVPGGVEVWVATETAVGSDTPGTYTLLDTVPALLDPLRTRWTVPSPAPNDGKLRYIKTQSASAGYTACGYSDAVSINPWTLVNPTDPGDDGDPNNTPGLGSTVAIVPLLRPGMGGLVLLEVGADEEVLVTWRGTESKPVLTDAARCRLIAEVVASTLPEGAYIACRFETPDAAGDWHPLEDDSTDATLNGPSIPVDPDSLDVLDENTDEDSWNVSGAWVEVRDEAKEDVRVRLTVTGGDGTGAIILGDVDLMVEYGSLVDVPDEIPDTPTEDPGGCTVPTPIDMDTGWTGGNDTGVVWSAGSNTGYTVTLDGSGTGANYWEKTISGFTADTEYTFYLTVDTSDVGPEPFLEVVGGDTDTATDGDAEELVARGTSDGSGNFTLRYGVQDAGGAAAAEGSDGLEYANTGALNAGGWTDAASGVCSLTVGDTTHVHGGTKAIKFHQSASGTTGQASITKTFTGLTPGASYTVHVYAYQSATHWWDSGSKLAVNGVSGGGGNDGTVSSAGVWEHLHVTQPATGAGELVVTLKRTAGVTSWSVDVWFDDLSIEGLAGGTAIDFSDLGSCLGTGKTQTPGETGGGEDGTDPIPDPPPGGYPPPPVGGDRPFTAYGIPTGGLGYWNGSVKKLKIQFAANQLNETTSNGVYNFFVFGETRDWLTGGKFDYNKWKAVVDAIANDTTVNTLLEAAIASAIAKTGGAFAHHVIDEPYHPTRYGGPISIATVERMCLYSKSIWPTWPTLVRTAPTFSWITKKINGCDWLWAEYLLRRGDVTEWRDSNIARAQELGYAGCIMGLHYAQFTQAGGRDITPAEIIHYGKILAAGDPEMVPAFGGWQFQADWYKQPGAPDAVRQVRDYFAGKDP